MVQMSGLIDVHAHILPGADDGAASMEEAREMLMMAWKEGIREIIATPHYVCGSSRCSAEKIRELLPEKVIRITIEKQLEKGFDYRTIIIEGMEEEHEDTGH